MSEMTTTPRAYTETEVRDEFITSTIDIAKKWAALPDKTVQERCYGVAGSILQLIDGKSLYMPGFKMTVNPHPDDKAYCISQGKNWYEPGLDITSTQDKLQELFYRGVSD